MQIKIKNQRSRSKNVFDDIQKELAIHKARRILFEYNQSGRVDGMAFGLEINGNELSFRLPARVANLAKILFNRPLTSLSEKEVEHCYQVAWANIRDWISAQLAMVDTEMVAIGEVFLPYFVHKDGKTHFEYVIANDQLLLN